MIKLSPDVKYGCPRCDHTLERTRLKEIKELAFLLDDSNSMKQTTLQPFNKKPANKLTTLF